MYLNHDLASIRHKVELDGNNSEWKSNTDAAFIGSVSQAQASVRFSEDADNIYFLVERLDRYLDENKDTVSVFFAAEGASEYYKAVVGTKGLVSVQKFTNKRPSEYKGACEAVTVCSGTVGAEGDDNGYVTEISFGKSDAGFSAEGGLRVTLMLANKDGREEFPVDNLQGHNMTDISTWQYVRFCD
jgi:hypothetical protein